MNALLNDGAFDAARANIAAFRLEDQGYCIIRKLVSRRVIKRVARELDGDFAQTPFCRGPFYGEHTKRFGRLLARSETSAALVLQPTLLEIANRILGPWCDAIQLNVAQAIEIHPGAPAQYPHRDQDMWQGPKGVSEYLVNVMWPLTPFTQENGATRIWPESHGATALDASGPQLEAVAAECEPGDAIVFLGSTLHGAGANVGPRPRQAIVIGYSLGWLRAYENQSLAYPPEIARGFPADLARLVGYQQHRPNLGNFEGQCPSVLLEDWADRPLGAIDALRPDQAALLAEYVCEQRNEGAAEVATSAELP